MAFQQPLRPQPARNLSYSTPAPPRLVTSPQALYREESSPQQSREWILFSPGSAAVTEERTISTARTPRTAGRSRLSELGSLDTAAVSERYYDEDVREEDLETEDLDSLDDGLHEFHEPSMYTTNRPTLGQSAETVLPTHDGLGTFPGNGGPVQEQFWQHERHNPRRRHQSHRRSDMQRGVDVLDEEQEQNAEHERFQRIEKWRMDQSRAILDEIERETKRKRRRSRMSAVGSQLDQSQTSEVSVSDPATSQQNRTDPSDQDTESFWTRFTRRVIRDLMGFDDATLSIIFGEELVEEPSETPSATEIIEHAKRTVYEDVQLAKTGHSWEDRLLSRIAKELGILVNQLSEHPGAFTTYLRAQDNPPYAGLTNRKPQSTPQPDISRPLRATTAIISGSQSQFTPTLANHQTRHYSNTSDASLWGIEEETPDAADASASTRQQEEREYWERDLDIKMVLNFLRNRFSSSPPPDSQPTPCNNPQPDHRSSASSLRRAALIRHHHPLVSRNVAAAANMSKARPIMERSRTAPQSPPVLRRRHSGIDDSVTSCASQSTKRSKTGKSGSSRNYWDVGGGVAGGSLGSGGWGSAGWGEV